MNKNDQPTHVQEDDRPNHAELVEQAIRGVLSERGLSPASHASALAEAMGLSASQVRRKLRLGLWTVHDVLVIQERMKISLASVLSSSATPLKAGTLLINGQEIDCEVRPGPVMTPSSPPTNLACSRVKGAWLVSTLKSLDEVAPNQLRHAVDLMQVVDGGSPLRIAVLDDDFPTAEALADWFNENGYPSKAYATTAELEDAGLENFDAFILDVVLKRGTSYDLIRKIRAQDSNAVIMLLTGKVRGNIPRETEMAEVVRDHHVEFAVKPTSPALLQASILSSIARRRT